MKKMILFFACFIFLVANPAISFADNVKDEIGLILCEYINGEKTGNYYHLELTLESVGNKIVCDATHEYFTNDDFGKSTSVSLAHTNDSCDNGFQLIEKIQWKPGKALKCQYNAFGGLWVKLEAKKVFGTNNEWTADGKGFFQKTDYGEKLKWELKSTKYMVLKHPKIGLITQFQ